MNQINSEIIKQAFSQYGIAEIVGNDHNPIVLGYYKEAGHSWVSNDETPWCAAFVCAMLGRANVQSTRKLNARSFLTWGVRVTDNPTIGDVVVLWREVIAGAKGHVGFYIHQDEKYIYLLGGNQGNKVCVERYDINRVLDIRRYDMV